MQTVGKAVIIKIIMAIYIQETGFNKDINTYLWTIIKSSVILITHLISILECLCGQKSNRTAS